MQSIIKQEFSKHIKATEETETEKIRKNFL